MAIIYLISAFILNAAGTIVFKLAANRGVTINGSLGHILSSNYLVALGFFFFGANAILYILALRTLPLSLVYPVMAIMSLLIVGSASTIVLHEKINTIQLFGYLLLIISVIIIFHFGKNA